MKLLVVQMLRLGDILMSAPVISGLRRKYPSAQIHVLAFHGFRQVETLFQDRVTWHWIDRDGLQQALGDADVPFFRASDLLEKQLKPLHDLKFDRIYNLTQTIMSGWVCTYIAARETIGLHFDARGQARFGSAWFQYLNDYVAAGRGEIFHYLDLFRFACDLADQDVRWNFRRSKYPSPFPGPYVLAQVTTSDKKKNYPIERWRETFTQFLSNRPEHSIGVLASPAELETLQGAFASVDGVRVLPCDLPQALTLMDGAQLLITGDTSLKHLACASRVPILELSLGSSDHRKTGVYRAGNWIVQGKTPCSPCPHASPCSRSTHECAAQVTPSALAHAMQALAAGTPVLPPADSGMEWLETWIGPTGIWMTKRASEGASESQLRQLIEKSTWKFVLQREFLNPLASYGSESLGIRHVLKERFPHFPSLELRQGLDFLESETEAASEDMSGLFKSMEQLLEKPLDPNRQRQAVQAVHDYCKLESRKDPSVLDWAAGLEAAGVWPQAGEKVMPLFGLRRLQTRLDEMFRRHQVKLKLIRSLKTQIPERQ